MDYGEILELVITELTEQGCKQQRRENAEVNELILRRIALSEQVQACTACLNQEALDTLENYHNVISEIQGYQIKYLYVQGAKDCILSLRELGVIR